VTIHSWRFQPLTVSDEEFVVHRFGLSLAGINLRSSKKTRASQAPMPVVRDLGVDRSALFENLKAVTMESILDESLKDDERKGYEKTIYLHRWPFHTISR
jgi:hypothetical protein